MTQAHKQRGSMRRSLLTGVVLLLPLSACIAPPIVPAVIAKPSPSRLLTAQAATGKTQPQALTLYQPLQSLPWEGQFISQTGIAYFALANASNDSVLESDLEPARLSGDRQKLGRLLAQLGLAQQLQGEYDKAIEYYKTGLAIAKELGNDELEGMLLGNLGLAHVQKGFYYTEAFDYLQAYWQFVHDRGDRVREAQAMGNLGNAYYGGDLYVQAFEWHQKHLNLARQLRDRAAEGKALGDMGIVYQALGETTHAIANYQQQLEIARQTKDWRTESMALGNLGIAYQTLGETGKAIAYQQQRLTLARQNKALRAEAEALANLGGAYYLSGDVAKAIALYDESWKVTWEQIHDASILYKIRGNQALAYAQMGSDDKALEYYSQFFRYAASRNDRRAEGLVKNNAAIVRFHAGNLPAAAAALRESIGFWESLRSRLGSNDSYKVNLFETQNAPYENLQAVLVAQQQPNAALEIAERGRARAFAELLSKRLTARSKQSAASSSNAIAPPTLAQLQQTARTHQATLVEYSILSANSFGDGSLQPRESTLLLWVIQPNGTVTLRQVDLTPLWQKQKLSLQALVLRSRNAIGLAGRGGGTADRTTGTLGSSAQSLQQLHQLLIQPIADLLPTNPADRVIFIPQKALFLLPFAALQDANGKYLIEQHTILTAPSIQVLDLTYQQRQQSTGQGALVVGRPRTSGLVIGNPTMPNVAPLGEPPEPLPPLPGAEAEARAIAPLLNTQALTGGQATKAAIVQQLPNARIIHLATHGIFDDVDGLSSAIALAPSGSDNGLLTAAEILDFKLKAELVVLSACNTGRGRITGDGVIGLSRAVIAAGAPSVIVSLWSIPDAPTSLLMAEFYKQLQTNPDKAQALRLAMLATMKEHPKPVDWAAFILVGEP